MSAIFKNSRRAAALRMDCTLWQRKICNYVTNVLDKFTEQDREKRCWPHQLWEWMWTVRLKTNSTLLNATALENVNYIQLPFLPMENFSTKEAQASMLFNWPPTSSKGATKVWASALCLACGLPETSRSRAFPWAARVEGLIYGEPLAVAMATEATQIPPPSAFPRGLWNARGCMNSFLLF